MCKNSASGYGAKRRAHDPDYEHVENAKYREYERLEAEGYDDELKDPETNRPVIKKVREGGLLRLPRGRKFGIIKNEGPENDVLKSRRFFLLIPGTL
jgi:hypothetical protein